MFPLAMIDLPEYAIIGNPLYCPTITPEGERVLEFHSTSGGLWIATIPLTRITQGTLFIGLKRGAVMERIQALYVEGALYENHFRGIKISFGQHSFSLGVGITSPVSLDELLEEGMLKKTSYEDYFAMRGLTEYSSSSREIASEQNILFYVTKKGSEVVGIGEKTGIGRRELTPDKEKEILGLVPDPVGA